MIRRISPHLVLLLWELSPLGFSDLYGLENAMLGFADQEIDPQFGHTVGHLDCPVCSAIRSRSLIHFLPSMLFEDAAATFRSFRSLGDGTRAGSGYVRRNTQLADERQLSSLALFFGGMALDQIHWFHMRGYQEARDRGAEPFLRYRRPQDARAGGRGKTPCPAKPAQINQELAMLRRLKRLAGCWTAEDDRFYRPLLEEPAEVPRALTPAEQSVWLATAHSRERWELVYWYSLLAFDTCASPNELRLLRLGDVHLGTDVISIPWAAAKNRHRHREVVVRTAEARWALERIMARASYLGATSPVAYLFPFGLTRDAGGVRYDVTRPMTASGMKRPWQEVREASGLRWFRIEDTRHTGATRLAEGGVSPEIIMQRMGHARPEMRLHYTHISEAAQRAWLRDPRAMALGRSATEIGLCARKPVKAEPEVRLRSAGWARAKA